MSNSSYASNMNIKRFQNLLDTSVDKTEREMLQRLLNEEKAAAERLAAKP
jgi:hypothetical protein